MTKQIDDLLIIDDKEYIICNRVNLYTPQDFGMKPVMHSTGLWRGFRAEYMLDGEQLKLKTIYIHIEDMYQPINGQMPINRKDGLPMCYQNVNINANFDYLLIGHNMVDWNIWQLLNFSDVRGLHFHDGKLMKQVDYSQVVDRLRFTHWWRKYLPNLSVKEDYLWLSKHIPLKDYGFEWMLISL